MRCIFCEVTTGTSKSVEHIIPESLGNSLHVLPPNIVCDSCNNYFARKVEQPALETSHFVNLRARQALPNKRGRSPVMRGIYPEARMAIGIQETTWGTKISPLNKGDTAQFLRTLSRREPGRIFVPDAGVVDNGVMSRLLAKIGVEILAFRLLRTEFKPDVLIDEPMLNGIRQLARYGNNYNWSFSERRIYAEDELVGEHDTQVLHEFDILESDDTGEWFAVVCIFGVEYAISLIRPSIIGYNEWLVRNSHRSPLYRQGTLPPLGTSRPTRMPFQTGDQLIFAIDE